MKRILTLSIILCTALMGFAQVDTTGKQNKEVDTIKVGGMIIIRKHNGENEITQNKKQKKGTTYHHYYKPSNLSTNWWIIDFGFSNYNDQTNYSSQETQDFAPGTNDESLKIKTWKSRNMNIWLFMQRLNMIQHIVNLKYGFGLELNNYFYDDVRVHLYRNPTKIEMDTAFANLDKNKLAADYLTVPLMLNFNFTPGRERGFGVSFGVSAGLLYSSRQKVKNGGDVSKTHDDFSLRTWKISYVGEILLGPVKLYGSYATQSMWEKGLDQTPYTVGLRFSY
ncbi:MAG TPA: hypothetical protein VGQ53_08120 [Chitinophagaceae bacterium]|jgi:hypothetical protein|nr:hypothetical protein [Chitinophagaceae bacterium]